ncbi:hypothetical protein QBC34DRAFT_187624 [Podospora aff. communis PSN243]|uniref:FAD-binding domain-containing protein n=1 Tax=Podospora aff. communis PSN243 TaxID=3040156 RepID=A0AAV9G9J4_9PEZI|nr:hypothetical protein QBC34DRAFT_187624 [Podospora aff. communis PSN243]
MSPPIAIIGGGPCGLTLARLLQCKGIDYIVYERDESEHSVRTGGSLDIHPETGQRALQEAGLLDEFKKHARYDDTVLTIADKSGKKLLQMGQGRDAPEIDRRELRKILLDSIPKEKIKWGHTLKSAVMDKDGRPVLHFGNGAVASGFALVVGADGAWSKIRPLVSPSTPQYTGRSHLESHIPPSNPHHPTLSSQTGPGMTISIASAKLIITQRQGDTSYRTYFGLQVPSTFFQDKSKIDLQDPQRTREVLLSTFFSDWAEQYQDLIRHSTDFRAWPLYTLPVEHLGWKSVPGVTLAGDAAHLAVPNGEGVNLAMKDALELVNKIAEHGMEHVDEAVKEYEAEMFPRGAESIRDGEMMAKVMFSEDPRPLVEMMTSFGAGAS